VKRVSIARTYRASRGGAGAARVIGGREWAHASKASEVAGMTSFIGASHRLAAVWRGDAPPGARRLRI